MVPGAAKTPSAPTAASWAASLVSRETTPRTVVSGDTGKDQHTQLCQGKKLDFKANCFKALNSKHYVALNYFCAI